MEDVARVEEIADDIPEWALAARAEGSFFRVAVEKVEKTRELLAAIKEGDVSDDAYNKIERALELVDP